MLALSARTQHYVPKYPHSETMYDNRTKGAIMKFYAFISDFAGESCFSHRKLYPDMLVLLDRVNGTNGTLLEYTQDVEGNFDVVNEYPVNTIEPHELNDFLEDMPEMNATNYRTIERSNGTLTIVGLHTRKVTA
jgi:hypothetical protein